MGVPKPVDALLSIGVFRLSVFKCDNLAFTPMGRHPIVWHLCFFWGDYHLEVMAVRAIVESAIWVERGRSYHKERTAAFRADALLPGSVLEIGNHVVDCETATFGI